MTCLWLQNADVSLRSWLEAEQRLELRKIRRVTSKAARARSVSD